MKKKMTDIEILEKEVGGIKIKEMTAITFLGWIAGKLNGVTITNNPKLAELRAIVSNPPIAFKLAEESKISNVRKMLALGITI